MKKPALIFLTGIMGSGKTTVGKILARRLGWAFADTDALVKKKSGLGVSRYFALHGEAAFRKAEAEVLRSLLGPRRGKGLVVATGGGMVLGSQNRSLMKRHGMVIHLRISPGEVLKRLGAHQIAKRPLISGGTKKLEELARSRAALYAQAHHKVLAARAPERVAEAIERVFMGKTPQVLHDKTPR
jgi:shikimate kinase